MQRQQQSMVEQFGEVVTGSDHRETNILAGAGAGAVVIGIAASELLKDKTISNYCTLTICSTLLGIVIGGIGGGLLAAKLGATALGIGFSAAGGSIGLGLFGCIACGCAPCMCPKCVFPSNNHGEKEKLLPRP